MDFSDKYDRNVLTAASVAFQMFKASFLTIITGMHPPRCLWNFCNCWLKL